MWWWKLPGLAVCATLSSPNHKGGPSCDPGQWSAKGAAEENAPFELSPEGTAESSPGRQSWVYIHTATSPAGTTENAPGRQSWVKLDPKRMPGRRTVLGSLSFANMDAQDYILGYSQPSLTGLFMAACLPRTASWATFSRPCGTEFVGGVLTRTRKPPYSQGSFPVSDSPTGVGGTLPRAQSANVLTLDYCFCRC
jgi:hypothetical protein